MRQAITAGGGRKYGEGGTEGAGQDRHDTLFFSGPGVLFNNLILLFFNGIAGLKAFGSILGF